MSASPQSRMAGVVIYTSPFCGYCTAAKALLRDKGVEFEELDLFENPAWRHEMIERSGRTSVPQIFIGQKHIGGFDDLRELDARGGLEALLAAATAGA